MKSEVITSLRKQAEEAVADMPEGPLKVKAFEVILSRLLDGADEHTRADQQVVRSRKQKNAHAKVDPPSSIREEVKKLEISPDEAGVPPWNSLAVLDKYLWILEVAHRKGLDTLMAAEIGSLIFETFRESHRTNQVNNLKTRIKQGHVRITIAGWQILKGGKDRLQALASADSARGTKQ